MKRLLFLLPLLWVVTDLSAQSIHNLFSPNGKLRIQIAISDHLEYALYYEDELIVNPSRVSVDFASGLDFGLSPKLRKKKEKTVDGIIPAAVYAKRAQLREYYHEVSFSFKGKYRWEARAYDEGVAFRFVNENKKLDSKVISETFEINLRGNDQVWASHPRTDDPFVHAYEDFYAVTDFLNMKDKVAVTPLLVETKKVKLIISDADVYDYPVMYLQRQRVDDRPAAANSIQAKFAPYPLEELPGDHMDFHLMVPKRADYIARKSGAFSFPWRILGVAEEDAELLDNNLVYLLNRGQKKGMDFNWVQPGKVAWDWYNDWNLQDVDFKTGINTQTYKYYIDFAAANKLEYINLDEGWSEQFDLLKYDHRPNFDLMEVLDYAKEKEVKVFIWCVARTLDTQMTSFMPLAESWGIAGLKVDFMDRDDQIMVNFYERAAALAAKHKLLLNFHGAYKPTGMEREYPNIINREAVRGLEYNKFDPLGTTPEHAVTIPFIRGFAGAMDYTPGAMVNAQKDDFSTRFSRPMSQGTRAHQLAMYVVYDAPLSMLADAPTRYENEPVILEFLKSVPTMWDETVPLQSKVGDFIAIARRKGDQWWIGAMTDWSPRKLDLDLSFLKSGVYEAKIYQDGPNSSRLGEDYQLVEKELDLTQKLEVYLEAGGGAAIVVTPRK